MSIQEIKSQLHQIIDNPQNEPLLERILALVEIEIGDKDFWDELTPAQQARLNKSLEQAKDPSKCIPHAEAMEMFAKLKKG